LATFINATRDHNLEHHYPYTPAPITAQARTPYFSQRRNIQDRQPPLRFWQALHAWRSWEGYAERAQTADQVLQKT
jgi:hypothetical protein